jgi:hypothetical protein
VSVPVIFVRRSALEKTTREAGSSTAAKTNSARSEGQGSIQEFGQAIKLAPG